MSTLPGTSPHRTRSLAGALSTLFALSTVLFILGGALIVVLQLLAVLAGRGETALAVAEAIGPYAFGASTVAGLFAFALTYVRPQGDADAQE